MFTIDFPGACSLVLGAELSGCSVWFIRCENSVVAIVSSCPLLTLYFLYFINLFIYFFT